MFSIPKLVFRKTTNIGPFLEVDPSILKNYDLVVLGSGIYAGKVHKKVSDFMKKVTDYPPKFAFFNTHQSPTAYQKAFRRFTRNIEENNSEVVGEFDCIGYQVPDNQSESFFICFDMVIDQVIYGETDISTKPLISVVDNTLDFIFN